MSLRLIARDLYRLLREEEKLETALMEAPVDERSGLGEQLRKVKAERTRLQRMLEGAKEPPAYRKAK